MIAFANISADTTDSLLVAGVPNKQIIVKTVTIMAAATDTPITFNTKGSGAGVAISPTWPAKSGGGFAQRDDEGLMECAAGQGLTATTGSGSSVAVHVTYYLRG